MNRTLYFKTIVRDSMPISAGQRTYSFLTPSFENNPSVAEMTEAAAVRWLINDPSFREDLIKEFFSDPHKVRHHFELQKPFTRSGLKPGDIDLLFTHSDHPDQAVAFEVKRVKVVRTVEGIDTVNRLPGITEGIEQANAYRALGFYQTYLLVIILDDGRHIETPNIMFRYNKTQKLELIYNIPISKELHPEVGVIYVRINQFTGKHIDHSNSIGYCIDKTASRIIQTTEMTNKVRSL
jgi:hypothetical protein